MPPAGTLRAYWGARYCGRCDKSRSFWPQRFARTGQSAEQPLRQLSNRFVSRGEAEAARLHKIGRGRARKPLETRTTQNETQKETDRFQPLAVGRKKYVGQQSRQDDSCDLRRRGSMSSYLAMMPNITSSAPPPIDISRASR